MKQMHPKVVLFHATRQGQHSSDPFPELQVYVAHVVVQENVFRPQKTPKSFKTCLISGAEVVWIVVHPDPVGDVRALLVQGQHQRHRLVIKACACVWGKNKRYVWTDEQKIYISIYT